MQNKFRVLFYSLLVLLCTLILTQKDALATPLSNQFSNVKQISVGLEHICVIDSGDKLYCLGINSSGQLGINTAENTFVPTPIYDEGSLNGNLGGKGVVSLATGNSYTCAINEDKQLYCWGLNSSGRLGNNKTSGYTKVPSLVQDNEGIFTNSNIISVSTGNNHTCAIKGNNSTDTTGTLFCWGINGSGQLGDETNSTRSIPVKVSDNAISGFINSEIKSVSIGRDHTCAINGNKELFCWGSNYKGKLGNGTNTGEENIPIKVSDNALVGFTNSNILSVSVANDNTCAISNLGILYCWGENLNGQLADGTNSDSYLPIPVNGDGLLNSKSVKTARAGSGYICAINTSDELYCWGKNNTGQLGDGTTNDSSLPVPILNNIKSISCYSGTFDSAIKCAIDNENKPYCWGGKDNPFWPSISSNIMTPLPIFDSRLEARTGTIEGQMIKHFSVNQAHTCAINNEDNLYCWGVNYSGQLGNGTNVNNIIPALVLDKVKGASAGWSHSCAIDKNDQLLCWGDNGLGELGNGTNSNSTFPIPVNNDLLTNVESVSAGVTYTCAISKEKQLFCWGQGSLGKLGNGGTSNTNIPTHILDNISIVSTGMGDHTCAIDIGGILYCWGSNSVGQLGINTNESYKSSPTQIYDDGELSGKLNKKKVVNVSVGQNHTCAINEDNKLYCWGKNYYGKLEDDTYNDSFKPILINQDALLSVKSVSVGYQYTCVINDEGKLYCFGKNNYGKLGDGTIDGTTYTPTPIYDNGELSGTLGGKKVISVNAGQYHTCALNEDNKLYCWGDNRYGRCTQNEAINKLVPNILNYSECPFNSYKYEIGAECNAGKGVCQRGGIYTCTNSDLQEVECVGDINYPDPRGEICSNELDDNCDGIDDELECSDYDCSTDPNYSKIGSECSITVGECSATDTYYCDNKDDKVKCDADPGTPKEEICNNIDDDCDGYIDNNPIDVGKNCTIDKPVGYGVCANTKGTSICKNGDLICEVSPLWENKKEEICDGKDNDCDGVPDNNTVTVVDGQCYNPSDYNKAVNEITDKIKPLPPIVVHKTPLGKIEIIMEKYTIGDKLKKKLQKRALKKFGLKKAKLKVYYYYEITSFKGSNDEVMYNENIVSSENLGEELVINALAKRNKNNKVIKRTVRKNDVVEKSKLKSGEHSIKYKVLIQMNINKKSVTVWGNQKSNKWSDPVKFSI